MKQMKILGIKVTGFRFLQDDFTMNLECRSRVTENDYEDEVIKLFKNVNFPSSIAIIGKNSSGKSTILKLLADCYYLLRTGQWFYKSQDFNSDKILLTLVFGDSLSIYRYSVTINKPKDVGLNDSTHPLACLFTSEDLRSRNNKFKRKEEIFDGYSDNLLINSNSNEGKPVTSLLDKNFVFHYGIISASMALDMRKTNYLALFNTLPNDLKRDLTILLDDSIEKIEFLPNTNDFSFKRKGFDSIRLSYDDLSAVLSDGAKRGLLLFSYAFNTLKDGGTLLVDEIEGSFHKNLVNNVIYLFNDEKINVNKANLVFSTHYAEILDSFRRRDSIFVCSKNEKGIGIKNVYSDFKLRGELSKSNQFNSNAFDTLLNYDLLIKIKEEIKNEIPGSN